MNLHPVLQEPAGTSTITRNLQEPPGTFTLLHQVLQSEPGGWVRSRFLWNKSSPSSTGELPGAPVLVLLTGGRGGGGRTPGGTPGVAPAPGSRRAARPGQSFLAAGQSSRPSRAAVELRRGAVRREAGRWALLTGVAVGSGPAAPPSPAAASDPAPSYSCTKPPSSSPQLPLRPFHNKTPPIRYFPCGSFLSSAADSLDASEHFGPTRHI